jgi:hypothetical protein
MAEVSLNRKLSRKPNPHLPRSPHLLAASADRPCREIGSLTRALPLVESTSAHLEDDDPAVAIELDLDLGRAEFDEGGDDSADLDVGALVPVPSADPEQDEAEMSLDLVSLLAPLRDDHHDEAGDGPADLEPSLGLSPDPAPALPLDDEASDWDASADLEALPELVTDEDSGDDLDEVTVGTSARDEAPPPWSDSGWTWHSTLSTPGPCSALAVGADVIAVGGAGVIWFVTANEAPHPVSADRRVVSVALVGSSPAAVLAATGDGELQTVDRAGRAALDPVPWPTGTSTIGVELHTLTGGVTGAVLARTANGRLLRSDDAGRRWSSVDVGGVAAALGSAVDAPLALVRSERGPRLLRGSHDGATWVGRALPPNTLAIALGDAPMIAGVDGCILVLDANRGLVLSTDDGATYRPVPGLAGATALATGRIGGRPAAWIALYAEASDTTDLVLLDLDSEQPYRVAHLDSIDPDDASARVIALAWDDASGRLWAVGGFGAGSFSPPRQ